MKPKIRAKLIPGVGGDYYIIQIRHRFLFFTWWETMKKGNNGIWHYGPAQFTKEEVDEVFEKFKQYVEQGCKFKTYCEQ